jgi:galactokinase
MKEMLSQKFTELFGRDAQNAYFAPGRINLIGEHIDYNGGFVMPCAINFGTYLVVSPNEDGFLRFSSLNFDDSIDIELKESYARKGYGWYIYPLGVINHFLKNGHRLKGLDMLFYGDIPIGSGLSSSASIEVVTAYALNELFNTGYDKLQLVKISKAVENDFVGVNSGIMDQFSVAFGQMNKTIVLNCVTLQYDLVNCKMDGYVLAVINTNKPRKLAESKYNERVEECNIALLSLQQELDIENLCDIDTHKFKQYQHLITDEVALKRAKHVVEENDRVKLAAQALADDKLSEFGRLMYASHNSLSCLYQVSGIELDTVVEYAKTNPAVAGARMTGAGFGGCAIALVKREDFKDFSAELVSYYTTRVGYEPSVYQVMTGDGVGVEHSVLNHVFA